MADFITRFFPFSTYHGARPWMVTVFSLLLLVIFLIFSTLMMYRLVRDTRRLGALDRKNTETTEILRIKDQIFGWILGMFMLMFVFAAAISRLG
ncbi:hypothetical protein KKF84_18610 [Myxococcota bacterium]|nr:hypothetical protein [Myxococcota bacterium]MBU1537334.1 hypothetical protein [Myxococcota bacterium]